MKTLVILSTLLVLVRTIPTDDEEVVQRTIPPVDEEVVQRPFIFYPAELQQYIDNPREIAAHLLLNPQLGRLVNDNLPQALGRKPTTKYETLADFLKTVQDPEEIVKVIAADPRLPLLDAQKMSKILPEQYVDYFDMNKIADIMQNPDEKIPLLNSILNSQRMEEAPTSCPLIEQKDSCIPHDVQVPGQIPCWSPGEYDVDCPLDNLMTARSKRSPESPFGLCCFDGCRNTCLQKQCKMVNTSYTELEMQERCTDQEREECREIPRTTCKEVCKDETVMVETEVPDQKCQMVTVQECRVMTVEEEVCTEEEQPPMTYTNQCPPPPPNPTCDPSKPVNQCWSPGTPDVDCPRNLGPGNWTVEEVFAPCCFNGCENVCVFEPVDPCPTLTGRSLEARVTKKVGPKQCQHVERCQTIQKECAVAKECKMVQKACKKQPAKPTQTIKQNCHMEDQQVCKPVEVTRTKPAPAPMPMPTITSMPMPSMPSVPVQTAMPSIPTYSSYVPTAGVRYPTAPIRPYFVNGGHKAKGHFKSKGFKSKGWSKGKGHHFSKRSTEEVEEMEMSKRGDSGEFVEVTREKRHMKSKGCKSKGWKKGKGKGCASAYPAYPIYPSNQYVLQPERVPVPPVYTASTVDSEFTIPESQGNWQWNFTGTWDPSNTAEPVTFTEIITQCTTEQVEVCDLLEVDEELPIELCEEEECFNTVDPECNTSEVVCEQVEECQETYITVCQVCQMVKKPVEECRDKPVEQCEEVTKTVEVPQTIKKCGEECTDFVAKECELVPFKECHPVEVEVEKLVPEQVCEWPQY